MIQFPRNDSLLFSGANYTIIECILKMEIFLF